MTADVPDEDEWLAAMAEAQQDGQHNNDLMVQHSVRAPVHPVTEMQGPFEESMREALSEFDPNKLYHSDASTRRKALLESPKYERTCAGLWKQKSGENYHPLWKLVAQISFGMHLLAQQMARSDDEVMKILQGHVDEMDKFLERTTEDFQLASEDIQDRIKCLRIPLEHVQVFESMLVDRAFRLSMVEGNEKIERIMERTGYYLQDTLKDIQKGLDSTHGLAKYLKELESGWDIHVEDLEAVYFAMVGNIEGWTRALLDLQLQGNSLGVHLVQLGGIASEMQRRVANASRKHVVSGSISRETSVISNSNPERDSIPQGQILRPAFAINGLTAFFEIPSEPRSLSGETVTSSSWYHGSRTIIACGSGSKRCF